MTIEAKLLVACVRKLSNREDEAAIRQMLTDGIDWTLFVRKAVGHGLAGLAGQRLNSVAPDMLPGEMRDAFRAGADQTRERTRSMFAELGRIVEAAENSGIDMTPFSGPILAIQSYGDLGLRTFGDLHLLVRDSDIAPAIAALRGLEYERKKRLTGAQLDLIRRLEGHESLFKKGLRSGVDLHARLTPLHMALNVDYAGLWRRARSTTLEGRNMLRPAPEDNLLVLALHGGGETWRRMGRVCDVAAFIGSNPGLDWSVVCERAEAQACLRVLLVTLWLARRHFNAAVPEAILAAERADPFVEAAAGRIAAGWLAEGPVEPPSETAFSLDRLRLHESAFRRATYVARILLLPGPQHVGRIRLPRRVTRLFAYVPIKILHDIAMYPLLRAYRALHAHAARAWDALASNEVALAVLPASAGTRLGLKRQQRARAEAERALAENANNLDALINLGHALFGLKRYKQAVAAYDKALAIAPENTGIWKNRGDAMRADKRKTALSESEEAPALDPHDANSWVRRAGFFLASQRFGEAAEASDRALGIDPQHTVAIRMGIRSRVTACDWRKRDDDERRISEGVRAGLPIITPFNHRAMRDSEAENLLVAQIWAKSMPRPQALWRGETYSHDKIRIAYLRFPTPVPAFPMVGVFEHHDRSRFETTVISHRAKDTSPPRTRVEAAFDRVVDVKDMSDPEVAQLLREMEIDIAVDLNGHAGSGRPGIFAHRPAPVQVNYPGYPGTMGVPFFDYIVADRTVIPGDQFRHYSEKVVYLPNSYQCNDSRRDIPQRVPSRAEAELPETGFVFCCFNNNHKITPAIFDVWMKLMSACPGSVLWLLGDYPYTMQNLRREAAARGTAPERLVFARRVPPDEHVARQRLADLFLDTLPYNAHATASDALWAGLPVLTCTGSTFPGRVAASLLFALGLPELVTSSLAEYEQLALAFARDPERLAAAKAKVARNRSTASLSDTAGFTRHLESAYAAMRERAQRGERPESFSVTSAQHSTETLNA